MRAFLVLAGPVRTAVRVEEPLDARVLGVAEPRGEAEVGLGLVQGATGADFGIGIARLDDAVGYRPVHPVALFRCLNWRDLDDYGDEESSASEGRGAW